MGSELVSDLPPRSGGGANNGSAPISMSEQFYEHLPYYLSIGMTYDQFWNDDCMLTRYYRKAHQMKQKRRNQELWLQGAYIYEVLTDVAPVLHAFAKRGTKATPYLAEPFALTNEEVKERKERDAKLKYDKHRAKLAAWAAKTNIQMIQEEVK